MCILPDLLDLVFLAQLIENLTAFGPLFAKVVNCINTTPLLATNSLWLNRKTQSTGTAQNEEAHRYGRRETVYSPDGLQILKVVISTREFPQRKCWSGCRCV
jgi:hypothetical protein